MNALLMAYTYVIHMLSEWIRYLVYLHHKASKKLAKNEAKP
jgi:hypothetical protein